jgi:phenylpropionate dioxygenase-like ring-hydroxylating dioxygenase large terminal subunit
MDIDLKDRVEQILNNGITERWWPVIATEAVGEKPVQLVRFGIRLVAWRGADGQVVVQRDLCPHRGAPLSAGFVRDGRITCAYHGVQIDTEGTIADVPALPGCSLIGKRDAVRTFPVMELQGAVFAWFGEGAPAIFTPPEEFTDPEWTGFLCAAEWKGNYRYAFDNLLDPMHGAYLHAESFTFAYGEKEDTFRTRRTPTGFIVEKEKQVGVNFDWTEVADTGAFWVRLDVPYPPAAGPGGHMRIIGFVTPIHENSCEIFFWRMRKVSGWQRDMWRFLYRNRLEERHWHVLEQDRVILEIMEPEARNNEKLYQHDIGVVQVRRLFEAAARAQVNGLAQAAE